MRNPLVKWAFIATVSTLLVSDIALAQRGRAGGGNRAGNRAGGGTATSPRDSKATKPGADRSKSAPDSDRARPTGDPDRSKTTPKSEPGTRDVDSPKTGRPKSPAAGSPGSPGSPGTPVRTGTGPVGRDQLNSFLNLPADRTARTPGAVGERGVEPGEQHINHHPDNQPFSPAWYTDHPNAWQAKNPHADAWAVASWNSVQDWLTIAAQPVYYGVPVAASETPASVEVQVAVESSPAQVEELADSGKQAPADDSEWLNLGTFAVNPSKMEEANHMVQLAVNHDGVVRGNYYDVVSDSSQEVQGTVDRTTQKVAWKAGTGKCPVFETTVASLTEPRATLALYFQNGHRQEWKMTRLEK